MHYRSLSLYLMIFSCSLSTYASIQLKFFERLKPQIEQAQYMIQLQRKHILEYSDGAPSGPIPQHIEKIAHAYHLNPKTLNTPQTHPIYIHTRTQIHAYTPRTTYPT